MERYKQEFPKFDHELPVELLNKYGFEDISWHNDACPAFWNESAGYRVWFNFKDISLREIPEMPLFGIEKTNDIGDGTSDVQAGENMAEFESWIEKGFNANALIKRRKFKTVEDVKAYLWELARVDACYHLDDDPKDIIWNVEIDGFTLSNIAANDAAIWKVCNPWTIFDTDEKLWEAWNNDKERN